MSSQCLWYLDTANCGGVRRKKDPLNCIHNILSGNSPLPATHRYTAPAVVDQPAQQGPAPTPSLYM